MNEPPFAFCNPNCVRNSLLKSGISSNPLSSNNSATKKKTKKPKQKNDFVFFIIHIIVFDFIFIKHMFCSTVSGRWVSGQGQSVSDCSDRRQFPLDTEEIISRFSTFVYFLLTFYFIVDMVGVVLWVIVAPTALRRLILALNASPVSGLFARWYSSDHALSQIACRFDCLLFPKETWIVAFHQARVITKPFKAWLARVWQVWFCFVLASLHFWFRVLVLLNWFEPN